ncbi:MULTISPECIES: gamma-glutamylcyclotransferase family protein [unclassified Streptomyces]|uniref:gamma-glutamylcyclotransferase family protein n=1 Tax=unclassified Streptomyces TaxID=2593676 RepID=UPI00381AFF41
MSAPGLPFFVYGTLRPGEVNHDLFLRGRTVREEPALLAGAVLYQGPGYPYAVEERGGRVTGSLVTPLPQAYGELLAALDRLEEYAPGDPRNLYERVTREVQIDVETGLGTGAGTGMGMGVTVEARGGGSASLPVRAWVYVAAPAVAARLRARGKLIESGDWLARR